MRTAHTTRDTQKHLIVAVVAAAAPTLAPAATLPIHPAGICATAQPQLGGGGLKGLPWGLKVGRAGDAGLGAGGLVGASSGTAPCAAGPHVLGLGLGPGLGLGLGRGPGWPDLVKSSTAPVSTPAKAISATMTAVMAVHLRFLASSFSSTSIVTKRHCFKLLQSKMARLPSAVGPRHRRGRPSYLQAVQTPGSHLTSHSSVLGCHIHRNPPPCLS